MNFNITDYKNLMIVFPAGLGGNHLMNLISLTSAITQTSPNTLIAKYEQNTTHTKTAHFGEFNNLQIDTLNIDKLKSSQEINLLCGHLGGYIWANDILTTLEKKLYLIITPSENLLSKSYQRMVKFNPGIAEPYIYHETCTLYNIENVSKLLNIPHQDISTISADILFSPNLNNLFNFLSDEFLLTFSSDGIANCTNIHKIWWESI